jgi:hypothetical protein
LCPALTIGQQPQVDVVEREGQRHAQPQDARRDLARLSARGRNRKGNSSVNGRVAFIYESIGRASWRWKAQRSLLVRRSIVFQSTGHVKHGSSLRQILIMVC